MSQTKNDPKSQSGRAPVLFIGHGSPMNAIESNPFTPSLIKLASVCPNPEAILCISAHWMTDGTYVTHMKHPRTIHDFHGFPQDLSLIQYSAPGSSEIAELIKNVVKDPVI